MSFFTRVLGKKDSAAVVSAEKSPTDLSKCSIEDLIEELRRRGLTVERNNSKVTVSDEMKTDNAAIVEQRVFNVLDSIEQWCKTDRHRFDKDRKFTQHWSTIYAFDWARTPRGYCCDANKSVKVGLGEYSSYEDAGSSQIVIIQHYDSERPGNYEKRNSWNEVPPVWAVAFSCEEMRELTKSVIDNMTTDGTLIHREPEGDFDPATEPWWSESRWLVENNKITGVHLLVKCTQDVVPQEHFVRFKMRGSTFELIEAYVVKQNKDNSAITEIYQALNALPLPEPQPTTNPDISYITKSSNAESENVSDLIVEGESLLEIRVSQGKPSTTNYEDRRDDTLCQAVQSATLTLTNPSDKRLAIKQFYMEFRQHGEGEVWVQGALTRLGVAGLESGYWGRGSAHVNFLEQQSFEVEEHASQELVFEGIWKIPKVAGQLPAYNGRPHNQRIHTAFPEPLRARLVLIDDADQRKTVAFELNNPPLEHTWQSYKEAVVASSESSLEGFGAQFNNDLWLCVENPLDLNKCIISVTTAIDVPNSWFVRVQSDRRDIGGSYNSATPQYLKKLAFKACLKEERPAEVEVDLGSATHCRLTGLIDYDRKLIYALHGVIEIEHEGKILARSEGYVRLDYLHVLEEDK